MSIVGTVESLWRYPVKSMRGEERDELFVGFGGVYGDRLFAFERESGFEGVGSDLKGTVLDGLLPERCVFGCRVDMSRGATVR
ncbi:MAG: hypothetical protein E4G91_09650 [Candidatus Zixiibacteriota bacterium]|nr:MAG: hypothetical protein E4G91_09650 [candidate division Zixibacteria bacterium]